MLVRDDEGVALRDHLEQVEKATGKQPEALKVPKIPAAFYPTLLDFYNLSRTREHGYSGPLPIKYSEVKAYQELNNCVVDIDCLHIIDRVYLEVNHG